MFGGLCPWVDYGCPQGRVAFDKGAVCVYVFLGVPCRPIWSDVGGIIRGCLHGYGGVWVLVGLFVVEMCGVFEV